MNKPRIRKRHLLKSSAFGEYFMDQFFFKIYTNKVKRGKVADQDIRKLQTDNIVSIVHEYMHYLHEVSTYVGTLGLGYSVLLRAILSKYVSKDLTNSDIDLALSLEDANFMAGIDDTIDCLIGDMYPDSLVKSINNYTLQWVTIKVPHDSQLVDQQIEIPELEVINGCSKQYLKFNKFYLYEGLAYELERVFSYKVMLAHEDEEDGTEYTILRYLSRHIVPSISIRTMLILASCSLAYVNCGAIYISMLERLEIELKTGKIETQVIDMIRGNVATVYADRHNLLGAALYAIAQSYSNRSSLIIAFTELIKHYLTSGFQRTKNPAFEVDMIFDKPLEDLLNLVPPCDFTYVFNNKNTFMRDFYGTTKFKQIGGIELAAHHNIFIAHTHYASVVFYTLKEQIDFFEAGEDEVCCPFFTSCDLKMRKENSSICNKTPWKTYDLSYNSDKMYCWYGKGVSLLKGIDIP
ncbi:hypothetical protein ASU31_00225 [Pedobacter ginsenosidimutans]|uniref:Uncharacterized protein n=1 Tax=Pedobacter ginsenosidimutans TaxID=687842 RepID=A0A0T5VVH3_9SPHI|nr:hypothetical protein [Pedobacter ginsenosidimutans]KRT17759.1 hypothetical protein ASU31_00225 [Pedobacter ginsenosidimutans]